MSKKCLAPLSRRRQTGAKVHGVTKSATFLLFLLPSSSNKNATTKRRQRRSTEEGWQQKRNKSRNSNPQTPDGGPGRWASPKKKVLQDYQEAITNNKIRLFLLLRSRRRSFKTHLPVSTGVRRSAARLKKKRVCLSDRVSGRLRDRFRASCTYGCL